MGRDALRDENGFDRRAFLVGAAGVAAWASARGVAAGEEDHSGHGGANAKLSELARTCVQRGEECVAHCLVQLGKGSTEMAACAARVEEMLAACTALSKLATLDSSHLAAFASATAEICDACEVECRKHEKKHAVCKACADSCAECSKACKSA